MKPVKKEICQHEFIKNNGITTCSKCKLKSILYLTPLPNKQKNN